QLSPDRDAKAPHREPFRESDLDLRALVERGLIRNLPEQLRELPPRISARTPLARAALGYLYANCGHCHNADGPLPSLGLDFDQRRGAPDADRRVLASALGQSSHFALPGEATSLRIAAGRPRESALAYRMASRAPAEQMPPLGTKLVDRQGLALIERWI